MIAQEGDWKIEEADGGDLIVWYRGKLPRHRVPEIVLQVEGEVVYHSGHDGLPDAPDEGRDWRRVLRIPRVERADFKAAVGQIP
jgi:hypothetical protein